MDIVNMLLPIAFSLVGIALVFLVIEVIKVLKVAKSTLEDIQPKLDATMQNVQEMTDNIQPLITKADPMMDSLQLTVDAVNLELMRVDKILENVGELSDAATSATQAVDNITNAPVKAAHGMAERVRTAFGRKKASDESVQLAEQRVAVAQALEEYKAAEEKEAKKTAKEADRKTDVAPEAVKEAADPQQADDAPKSYVKEFEEGSEPVIDPKVIAESSFFDGEEDAK